MHITSGLSPASGEMLDSNVLELYADQCNTYYSVDNHAVPESSHTVEIEYVYESPETFATDQSLEFTATAKEKHKTNVKPKVKRPPKPMVVDDQETDLTNLTWLQNITNIMSVPTLPIRPVSPEPQIRPPQNTRLQKFNQTIAKCQQDFLENKEDYRRDVNMKPPYSYSTLICMAMRNNNNKMTLSAIYSWIRENFKYYRNADPTWQNSIRHNLSLNKVFVKVARSKQEPGKGGFWKLDLAHLEGTKRISNRPHKKKNRPTGPMTQATMSEEAVAVANITEVLEDTPVIPLSEYTLEVLQPLPPLDSNMGTEDNVIHFDSHVIGNNVNLDNHLTGNNVNLDCHVTGNVLIDSNLGANVIVEPISPPPLIQEDDLTALLLNPTDWDDLQLDMLDNYLDSCFKGAPLAQNLGTSMIVATLKIGNTSV